MVDQKAVLARWQKTRSATLADILCSVPDAAWQERVASIARDKTRKTIAAARGKLQRLPDDPRVTVFLVQMIAKANWAGSSFEGLWKVVFAKLVELRDRRAIEPLRALAKTPPYFLGAGFTEWCVEQITATADALAKSKPIPDDAATTALAKAQQVTVPEQGWFAAGSGASADELLARVWAAPDDLALRSVIGDALQQIGDPWGDFIALSVKGGSKNAPAIKALLRKHGARFAGALTFVGAREAMEWEHGFVSKCRIDRAMVGRRKWEDVVVAKQWATIKSVELGVWNKIPKWWFKDWFAKSDLRSLREIDIATVQLGRDSATAPWKFTRSPKQIEYRTQDVIESVLRAMPPAELARIKPPTGPLATYLVDVREA